MAVILALGELSAAELQPITGELLAAGRGLCGTKGDEVCVALLGTCADGASSEAIALGADRVYHVSDPLLEESQIEAHLAAIEQVCRQIGPSVVLVGRTPFGRDIGPRLAFRLGVGVAQDCIELGMDTDSIRVSATRPVYGGNALATVTSPDADPQVVVLRSKVYEPLEPDPSRDGQVVEMDANLDPSVIKVRTVETVKRESVGIKLEDASIVIGGGNILRGAQSSQLGIARVTADYMGMLATVINGLALSDALEANGVTTRVMSALDVDKVCEPFIRRRALRHLEKGRVVILVGGLGNPYFTTDSTAAQRAVELDCDLLLKATMVDGVYDKDPKKEEGAVLLPDLTFDEVIVKRLRVMDQTAFTLCRENNLPLIVFHLAAEKGVVKAARGESIGTLVHN